MRRLNPLMSHSSIANEIDDMHASPYIEIKLDNIDFNIIYRLNISKCCNKDCTELHLYPDVFVLDKNSDRIVLIPSFNCDEDNFPENFGEMYSLYGKNSFDFFDN